MATVVGALIQQEWSQFEQSDSITKEENMDYISLQLTGRMLRDIRNDFWHSQNWRRRQRLAFFIVINVTFFLVLGIFYAYFLVRN